MTETGGGFKRNRAEPRDDGLQEGVPMTQSREERPGTVTYEGDFATLAFERHLDHPIEVVWDAITNHEQIARWNRRKARLEAGAGGSIDYVSGISQFHVTGKILTWDPPRVYEHEWNVEPREYLPHGERSVVRWELTPDGDGTILRITHRHLTQQTARGFVAGTHAFLDRLEDELDGRPLTNWVKRVEELRPVYGVPW